MAVGKSLARCYSQEEAADRAGKPHPSCLRVFLQCPGLADSKGSSWPYRKGFAMFHPLVMKWNM
jgi:hypothetical protein